MEVDTENITKHMNGSSSHSQDNGRNGEVVNGYSEKKHKDKHKDKDRHKHKSHKHDKDKDRDRNKDRDREREKEKEKEKSQKTSHSSPEKDRSKNDKVKTEHKSSSSSDKPKSENSSSRDKDSSKDSKHHKSKHKDKHREKDGEKERDKDRDKDRHREKDRDKDRNKDRDKEREKNREKDKERSKDKDKKSSSSHSEKSRNSHSEVKPAKVKEEVVVSPVKVEQNSMSVDSDDDVPLVNRKKSTEPAKLSKKRKPQSESDDDDDDKPLIQRKKVKTENVKAKKRSRSDSDDDYDTKKKVKSKPKPRPSTTSTKSSSGSTNSSPQKRRGKQEEDQEIWRWWEEAPRDDGVKWNFLEHKGPVLAAPYDPLPKSVNFKYSGKVMKLSLEAEEVAGFYSRFIEHEYSTKEKFNTNFFKDWRKMMTKQEREIIIDLKKCDFSDINEYYKMKSEERKAMSKEEKTKIKEDNEALVKEYGVCTLDGHKEKIGNFRIEPPGLFRGRGDHPKMGMLKRRVMSEDVTINCSKTSKWPEPPEGRRWKEVRHDNTVTWLACWTENVQGQSKYVMLNPTSRLKGEKDWLKYEKARELAKHIDKIRENYKNDFKSKEMRVRQRAVALYFIDKLALRAGNEKDEDQADTVGCCSLRVEHIELHDEKNGSENVVTFDFLGKDSIRYFNEVPVEKRVFKNLRIFMDNKKPGDDLFDRLNTAILNKHLSELMDGLTAKVFRTYNASHTLQQQLDEQTKPGQTVAEKVLAYNRANRAVAILCNHQRAVPKSHEKSMENMLNKIQAKKDEIKKTKKELKECGRGSKEHEKKSNAIARLQQQLEKLELSKTDKEEGKEIALGTSKLNYLDPRISVAWCKKHDIPVEKVYNKTQRAKFRWAIDMADKYYRFD